MIIFHSYEGFPVPFERSVNAKGDGKMNLHKIGVVLLALLLAGIAMVPMVSAANAINYSLVSDVSTFAVPTTAF